MLARGECRVRDGIEVVGLMLGWDGRGRGFSGESGAGGSG